MKTGYLLILMLALFCSSAMAQKNAPSYDISVSVTDAQTKEPIIMGTVQLNPLGQYAVTDVKGRAVIKNIPQGTYTLSVTYVGYETYTTNIGITNKNLDLNIRMSEASLALKEVSVTAKQNAAGTSTASIIGRQAIDHLQASSLADIMQLVPGQLMGHNNLMSQTNLQIRQLVNDPTAAFGSSVMVDGVPISNNGSLSQGPMTEFTGTDLRNISADDINDVEVVRGIPSAEYGDLSGGMVIVHSKVGVTPWQVKAKVNPALMNYSVGKGANIGKYGIINGSLDYATFSGDERLYLTLTTAMVDAFYAANDATSAADFDFIKWHGTTPVITDVQTVEAASKAPASNAIYNIMGSKVNLLQKGNVYIIDGKKVLK